MTPGGRHGARIDPRRRRDVCGARVTFVAHRRSVADGWRGAAADWGDVGTWTLSGRLNALLCRGDAAGGSGKYNS